MRVHFRQAGQEILSPTVNNHRVRPVLNSAGTSYGRDDAILYYQILVFKYPLLVHWNEGYALEHQLGRSYRGFADCTC